MLLCGIPTAGLLTEAGPVSMVVVSGLPVSGYLAVLLLWGMLIWLLLASAQASLTFKAANPGRPVKRACLWLCVILCALPWILLFTEGRSTTWRGEGLRELSHNMTIPALFLGLMAGILAMGDPAPPSLRALRDHCGRRGRRWPRLGVPLLPGPACGLVYGLVVLAIPVCSKLAMGGLLLHTGVISTTDRFATDVLSTLVVTLQCLFHLVLTYLLLSTFLPEAPAARRRAVAFLLLCLWILVPMIVSAILSASRRTPVVAGELHLANPIFFLTRKGRNLLDAEPFLVVILVAMVVVVGLLSKVHSSRAMEELKARYQEVAAAVRAAAALPPAPAGALATAAEEEPSGAG